MADLCGLSVRSVSASAVSVRLGAYLVDCVMRRVEVSLATTGVLTSSVIPCWYLSMLSSHGSTVAYRATSAAGVCHIHVEALSGPRT